MDLQRPFFLASCPDDALPEAIALVDSHGGFYSAGDAMDTLNAAMVLKDASAKDPDKNVPWKNAWLGKTKQTVDMLKKMCPPGTQITALAIAGGPACNWERQQLFDVYTKLYPNLRLKQLGDVEDLHIWLKGRANRAPHQLSEQLGRRATRSECGGKVYGLPCRADCLLVYDPATGALSSVDTSSVAKGGFKWLAAATVGGKVYGLPCCADCLLVYDPATGALSSVDTSSVAKGDFKWDAAATVGGKVYGLPDCADCLLVYDPATGALSSVDTSSVAKGDFKWGAAATVG